MSALVVSVLALFGIPLAFLAVLTAVYCLEQWRATRQSARAFGECLDRVLAGRDEDQARVLLFPATGRSVMGTPKSEARAAQTAEPLNGGAISDDRRS